MQGSDSGLYARSFADVYDAWYGDLDDPAVIVDAVQKRCNQHGFVVEFGSGTGRIALPLHQAEFRVVGIDVSLPMLRSSHTGPHPLAADMARIPLRSGCADVVIIAYNTLFNLTSQALQQRCIDEAARLLNGSGRLVIEAFVSPNAASNEFGVSMRSHPTDPSTELTILTGPHPSEPDMIVGSHIERGTSGTCRPWQLTYQPPAGLDASATSAGMTLEARFGDWSGAPFDVNSERHVSWYKPLGSVVR